MYYIISLKHTHKEDKYITLWRPTNSGYCYSQDQAGRYSEIKEGYHNGEGDSIAIEVSRLEGFFINAVIDSEVKQCVPNCKAVWDALNLKMTRTGLAVSS